MGIFKKVKIKKKLSVFLIFIMLISLSGCEGKATAPGVSSSVGERTTEAATESGAQDPVPNTAVQYAEEENQDFEDLMREYFEAYLSDNSWDYHSDVKGRDNPFNIEKIPYATYGDVNVTEEDWDEAKKGAEDFYDRLIKFENEPLTEEERYTYEAIKFEKETALHKFDNYYLYEPFSPGNGMQENYPIEFVDYQFDCKEDVDEYIELMKKLRDHFGDFIEYEHLKSEKGFFMSDSSVDSVIEQCDTFLKERDNNFVTEAFNEKIDKADFLSEEEKEDYKSQNKQAMEDSVFPAFEDLKATMEELKGTGTNDKGICYYEGGKEYYENYIFPSRSGSAKTVEEEIKVMDDRMTDLIVELSSIYYSNPEAYETYYNMLEDESLYKGFYDEGGEAVIDQLQEISKKEFPIDNEIPFTIRSMGENEGKIMESALAYYRICPLDDADYNVIVENSTHYDNLFYVLAHEGCPGHMLQNWYFRNTDASNARSVCMNLGYVEGWAVYASNQVLEECDFAGVVDDPEGIAKVDKIVHDLGYLMHGRLDIGINYEGWSLEDTEMYMEEHALNKEVAKEIYDIIAADPGTYLSYSTSYYEMLELRERAEEELGSKFDVVEYHRAILDAGPVPFAMLSKKVDEYIDENR